MWSIIDWNVIMQHIPVQIMTLKYDTKISLLCQTDETMINLAQLLTHLPRQHTESQRIKL
jgi:hypothetical protein